MVTSVAGLFRPARVTKVSPAYAEPGHRSMMVLGDFSGASSAKIGGKGATLTLRVKLGDDRVQIPALVREAKA